VTAPDWTLDYIDYPTAWWIQEQGLTHKDPRCSAAQTAALLCDCGAIVDEWTRRRAEALAVPAPDETCVICGKPSKDAECGECFTREDDRRRVR